MKISASENYEGYCINTFDIDVALNGQIVAGCIAADEEGGVIHCFKMIGDKFIVDSTGEPIIERVEGDVKIIKPDGWSPIWAKDFTPINCG